eukprot:TRINITY_DN7492_c0_g2_i1.p1 TRINITY_DN7492_c0_g2~~TRINITY_DN7492_c0_g2_i1.p1  ORF type:complete len:806 (+),score=99.40 TRINITY_DN7492_c0_g2_i1:117-2420(+)
MATTIDSNLWLDSSRPALLAGARYVSKGLGFFSYGIPIFKTDDCDSQPTGQYVKEGQIVRVQEQGETSKRGVQAWFIEGRGWICLTPEVQGALLLRRPEVKKPPVIVPKAPDLIVGHTYVSKGMGWNSYGIPIYANDNCNRDPRSPTGMYIKQGDKITVVERSEASTAQVRRDGKPPVEAWKLADGRGWVCASDNVRDTLDMVIEGRRADHTKAVFLRHKTLGRYLTEDLQGITNQETLLFLVQRDLKRLLRLGRLDTRSFRSFFPPDFVEHGLKVSVGLSAVSGALTIVGAMDFGDVVELATDVGGKALDYGSFLKWAEDYAKSQEASNKRLLSLGGKAPTDYWQDVPMGSLWEAYHKAILAQREYEHVAPTILKNVRISPSENCLEASERVGTLLQAGVIVKTIKKQTDFSNTSCIEIEYSDPLTKQPLQGWVPGDAVVPQGWYVSLGIVWSSGIPIYRRSTCAESDKSPTYIKEGQYFTIISKQLLHEEDVAEPTEVWKLGDGRGWLCVTPKVGPRIKGPLPLARISRIKEHLQNTALSPEAKGDHVTAGFSKANEVYNSPEVAIGKLALKGGLFVASFFTGGATLVPLAALSLSDSAAQIGLKVSESSNIESKVAYVVAAVAAWENSLFSGKTSHQACDLSSEEQPCAEGYVCLRTGVFERIGISGRHEHGYCVKSAVPALPVGSYCWQDTDCSSGHCDLYNITKGEVLDEEGIEYDSSLLESNSTSNGFKPEVLERMSGKCRHENDRVVKSERYILDPTSDD